MLITHPRLVTAYTLGVSAMVVAYSFIDEYKQNNANSREIWILSTYKSITEKKNSHEMDILKTKNSHEKYMLEAKHSHEKYVLQHSRWWKRL